MEEVVQIELTSRRTRSAVGAKNLARATRIGDVLGTRSWRAGELGVGGVVVVGWGRCGARSSHSRADANK
jgi:hypothetical protein